MIRNQLEGESSNDEAMNDENLVSTVRISVSFNNFFYHSTVISVYPVKVQGMNVGPLNLLVILILVKFVPCLNIDINI